MGSYALKKNNKRVKLGTRLQVASDPIGAVAGASLGVRLLADRIVAHCMQKNVENFYEPLHVLFAMFDCLENAANQNRAVLVFQVIVNLVKEKQSFSRMPLNFIKYLFEYLRRDKFFHTPPKSMITTAAPLTEEAVMHNLHQCKKIVADLHLNRRGTWWENEAGINMKMGTIVTELLFCEEDLIKWRMQCTIRRVLRVLPEEIELHVNSFLDEDTAKFNVSPTIPLFELNGAGYPYDITSNNLTNTTDLNPLAYWLALWIDQYNLPRPTGKQTSVKLSERDFGFGGGFGGGGYPFGSVPNFAFVGSKYSRFQFVGRRHSNIVQLKAMDVNLYI
jgi:hypothetical protein